MVLSRKALFLLLTLICLMVLKSKALFLYIFLLILWCWQEIQCFSFIFVWFWKDKYCLYYYYYFDDFDKKLNMISFDSIVIESNCWEVGSVLQAIHKLYIVHLEVIHWPIISAIYKLWRTRETPNKDFISSKTSLVARKDMEARIWQPGCRSQNMVTRIW